MARKVSGRAAFLAHFKEIEAELAKGQFASVVHGKFKDRLGFSYRQFAYYVREYELGPARPERSRQAARQPVPARRIAPLPVKPASSAWPVHWRCARPGCLGSAAILSAAAGQARLDPLTDIRGK